MQVNYPPKNFTYFNTPPGLQQMPPLATLPAQPVTGTDPSSGDFTNLDPLQQRQELAANALQEGSSMAPARGGYVEGLARLAQAFIGGKLLNKANTDITTAKANNARVMKEAVDSGDWSKLATADNPVANKLGDSLLEAQLKHQPTARPLTPDEIQKLGLPAGTQGVKKEDGDYEVKYRPTPDKPPEGYRAKKDGSGLEFVPGGPADPAVISKNAGGRSAAVLATKPKKAAPAGYNPGLPPWQQKGIW